MIRWIPQLQVYVVKAQQLTTPTADSPLWNLPTATRGSQSFDLGSPANLVIPNYDNNAISFRSFPSHFIALCMTLPI